MKMRHFNEEKKRITTKILLATQLVLLDRSNFWIERQPEYPLGIYIVKRLKVKMIYTNPYMTPFLFFNNKVKKFRANDKI